MSYIFILVTQGVIIILFSCIYAFFKTQKAIQAFQQSSYNNKRFLNYIKDNYKYSFGINELLPILFLMLPIKFINPGLKILDLTLVIIFLYYNIKFFNISRRRYTQKLPLKLTWRVKRLIITLLILVIVILFLLKASIVTFLIVLYFIYLLIILAATINKPIESYVQNTFKKKAIKKLNSLKNITVIGVTGSYGKTSIKNIVNEILNDNEPTLQTPASYNTPMGISITINNNLTPLYQNFIVEMGAYYEGEIDELTQMVNPKVGIVSSIGPQHLETFKNIETIQRTKMELIESLPGDGLGILNYDNKYIREYNINNNVDIKWYSLENEGVDLYAYDIKYLESGMSFTIKYKGHKYEIVTKLLGKHSIYNILAAILVADYKGISLEKTIRSIGKVAKIEHRLELKKINSELTIIDDSFNGNIEGMIEGVNILSKYSGTKILITPGIIDGGDSNDKLNEEYAKNIKDIDIVIFIGKYNLKNLKKGLNSKITNYNFDNFLEGHDFATSIPGKKVILIANDLPDKYN